MFHDATLAEGKKAQNKVSRTGHVFEMQVAFDIPRLFNQTISQIIPHAHELQLELLLQNCSGTIHSIRTPKRDQKKKKKKNKKT